MYGNQVDTRKIYNQVIKPETEQPVLASLVERCLKSEVDWGERSEIQNSWSIRCAQAVDSIADYNPYLRDPVAGEEIPALEAVAWVQGTHRGFDCRPKVFDGESKSWKLCDTGSMVTVIKKSKEDKRDYNKILQAVNGSKIAVYGQKEVNVRIGRKTYKIEAIVADVEQDILGWDFFDKYKLDFVWSDFGDLQLRDKKANIKADLKCVAVPSSSRFRASSIQEVASCVGQSVDEVAFEVASMKVLGADPEPTPIQGKYKKLIDQFPEIQQPCFKDLSTKHGITHKIPTGSHPPHKCKVRPLMPNSEKAVKGKEAWDQMVQLGVVEKVDPNAKTSWGSPLHLVPKPDNTMRPCSDFRQLNAKTEPDGYPIPALKSFTHKLHNARVFSKVDLFSAFHNIVIEPSDVEKTTTLTPWGVFVYKRLAFGLSGAPSTFMKLVDSVLDGIEDVYAYLDDFLVYSKDEESHFRTLKTIFQRLKDNGLAIKLSKCEFGKKSVEFLGYEVSKNGIRPLNRKVQALVDFPSPRNQKDLLHFLGALNYFRNSLKGIKKVLNMKTRRK